MNLFGIDKLEEVALPTPLDGLIAANMSKCDTQCCGFAAFEIKRKNFASYYSKTKKPKLKERTGKS